jgi:Holliday junction resolvase
MDPQTLAVERLERAGFQVARRTAAVVFLVHPAYPGLLVRVGTVYLVAERDGRELVRQRLDQLDVASLLAIAARATGEAA